MGPVDFSPRISVLFFGPFTGWGPKERGLLREAIQAKYLGFSIVICCPLDSYIQVEAKKAGIETHPVRLVTGARWISAYKDVFKLLIQRHQITHFHCYDSTSLFSCSYFLRPFPQIALIWSIHGTPPTLKGNWLEKILLRRTDRFLLPSSLSMTKLTEQLNIPTHKVARVGLAIDSNDVAWKEPDLIEGFIIGLSLVDGDESLQTTEVVARSLSLVLGRGIDNAKLLLHTPRDWNTSVWKPGLDQVIESLGLKENIEFVSGEDFSSFIGRVHISVAIESSVVPYDQIETCFLAGIPVVYPRNRSYRDLLYGVDVGTFSYKPRDSREMAEKILKLYSTWSEQRQAMQALREEHSKWHEPALVRSQLDGVYKKTMLRRVKYWRRLHK